jgi:hypothetical protein
VAEWVDHSIDIKWQYQQTLRVLRRLPVDKATQQALRKAARGFVQVARRNAPVASEFTNAKGKVVRGRLKASIHQSKRIRNPLPHVYSVKAGPMARGRVNLYRGDAERRHGYIRGAYGEGAAVAQEAFVSTYRRLLEVGDV